MCAAVRRDSGDACIGPPHVGRVRRHGDDRGTLAGPECSDVVQARREEQDDAITRRRHPCDVPRHPAGVRAKCSVRQRAVLLARRRQEAIRERIRLSPGPIFEHVDKRATPRTLRVVRQRLAQVPFSVADAREATGGLLRNQPALRYQS